MRRGVAQGYVTESLAGAHSELAVLPWHAHLPLQSGADRILRRMNRGYGRAEYLERARLLQQARPGFTLSTDVIVGFPSESEEDFQQTLELVREVGFVSAHAFKYSPRPHTPALKLGDPVPEAVKEQRLARLLELLDAQQAAYLKSLVGERTQVLLEARNQKDPRRFTGRSHRNEIVHVETPPDRELAGQLVPAIIERANAHSLMASLATA
jgi:tRNA-2-methylthio-N6-dimethylallyladenosine synthase